MLTFIVSSSLTEITREHGERDNTDTHGRRGTGMVADGERDKRLRRESRKTESACMYTEIEKLRKTGLERSFHLRLLLFTIACYS